MLAALSVFATAQTEANRTVAPAKPDAPVRDSTAQTTSDEAFELNIAERRITERDFEASTSIETGDESGRGLNLRVGVAVRAEEIDVLLRNVRGRVRFRATLEPLLRRIRRAEQAAPTPQALPSAP